MKRLIFLLVGLFLLIGVNGQSLMTSIVADQTVASTSGPPYTDNFEAYSTGTLGGQGDWLATTGDMIVVDDAGNNVVQGNIDWSDGFSIYNRSLADDQYSKLKIVSVNASSETLYSVGVRMSGSGATLNGYIFRCKDGQSDIARIDNGVKTHVSNWDFATTYTAGDVIEIRISGTSISVWINDVLQTQYGTGGYYTDATYSSGKACIGVSGNATDGTVDDFECGNL